MALYRNRFTGNCASGDIFVFTMWCLSAQDLNSIHQAALNWVNTLWGGDGTNAGYGTLCTASVAVTQVSTATINPDTGRQSTQDETSVNLPGSATGTDLPADVAIVVSERTAMATRSGRGRFYLPQPYAGVLGNGGRLATATTTTIANIAQSAYVGFRRTRHQWCTHPRTERARLSSGSTLATWRIRSAGGRTLYL